MPSGKPLKGERIALGRRLGKARKARGLSKAEAARQVGVRVQSWQQWEGGLTSPRPEKLTQIAGILGIDVYELLEGPRHFFDPVSLHCKAKMRVRESVDPYETPALSFTPSDLEAAPLLGFARLPAEVQYHLRTLVQSISAALERTERPSGPPSPRRKAPPDLP
jgi:transcriptional regulator with XRE-family HTH domain